MIHKILSTAQISDLIARCPPNQATQFKAFMKKLKEYKKKCNQYPDKLPKIDWEYYRNNVRKESVDIIEQFRIKYEELSHVFDSRHEVLDHRKYYTDLDKLTTQVKCEVKKFQDESKRRVAIYSAELRRIQCLAPYDNMTMEEFVNTRADVANFIPGQGKPLFWPHDEVEQCTGTAGECEQMALQGIEAGKKKDTDTDKDKNKDKEKGKEKK